MAIVMDFNEMTLNELIALNFNLKLEFEINNGWITRVLGERRRNKNEQN